MAKPPSEFVQSLLELMEPIGPITWRRMFGGYGLYRDGVMISLVADDEVYLKVDAETLPRFEAAGCEPFTYEKNGKAMQMSYWKAPEEIFDDPEAMEEWGKLAFGAALRQKK